MSTSDEKRKDRTPEEGSRAIYLRALSAALGSRQRKFPHTEACTKRLQSQTPSIETIAVKPETERNTEHILDPEEEENAVVTHTKVSRRGSEPHVKIYHNDLFY